MNRRKNSVSTEPTHTPGSDFRSALPQIGFVSIGGISRAVLADPAIDLPRLHRTIAINTDVILYRVMRIRLAAAKRSESPATLLEQLKRIYQQTVQTMDGRMLTGLTEMTPAQKSLFAALELALPTPENLTKPVL